MQYEWLLAVSNDKHILLYSNLPYLHPNVDLEHAKMLPRNVS